MFLGIQRTNASTTYFYQILKLKNDILFTQKFVQQPKWLKDIFKKIQISPEGPQRTNGRGPLRTILEYAMKIKYT